MLWNQLAIDSDSVHLACCAKPMLSKADELRTKVCCRALSVRCGPSPVLGLFPHILLRTPHSVLSARCSYSHLR